MKTMTIVKVALFTVVASFAAGCTADTDPMEDGEEILDPSAAKADAAGVPPGKYETARDVRVGDLATLTLGAGGSFSSQMMVVDCLPRAGCAPTTGTYKLSVGRVSGNRYLRFYDADGLMIEKYQYAYDAKTGELSLRQLGESRWFVLKGQAPADCRSDGCGDGSWCSYCWGKFACIPNGALC
jgi:hypothetical protein